MRGVIGVTSFFLLLGSAGSYELGYITTTDMLVRTLVISGVLILCGTERRKKSETTKEANNKTDATH